MTACFRTPVIPLLLRAIEGDKGMITATELRTYLTAGTLLIAALLLTGCAGMQAYQAETARWQAKADQITGGTVTVTIRARGQGLYNGQTRSIEIDTSGGNTKNIERLLAHELGHAVLGHAHFANTSLAQEMDANAKGVHILQMWGYSEQDAVRLMGGSLLGAQNRHEHLPPHDWCAELRDLTTRFPRFVPQDAGKVNASCPGTF